MASADLAQWLPPRRRSAHKGDHGHVLVVGGDAGMAGAVQIAGQAALRAGAGWCSLATRPAHAAGAVSQRPELMSHPVGDGQALAGLAARASVLAVGPGPGRGDWSRQLLIAACTGQRQPASHCCYEPQPLPKAAPVIPPMSRC